MKKSYFLLVFAVYFVMTGCGRIHGPVAEVNAFAEEKEGVLSEMVKKIEANPNESGIDDARKVFEGKKESLKAKREGIKSAPQGFNADWKSQLMYTESRHTEMLNGMGAKIRYDCNSEQCEEKWNGLEKDFNEAAKFYQ